MPKVYKFRKLTMVSTLRLTGICIKHGSLYRCHERLHSSSIQNAKISITTGPYQSVITFRTVVDLYS